MRDELRAAFEATRYRVFLGEDSHVLRIGQPCPTPVAQWIATCADRLPAWQITAFNPHAQAVDEALNEARAAFLGAWASRTASGWLATVNESAEGDWPDEPGLLAVGIEEGEMRSMARRLGQVAIVCVAPPSTATLIWCR